MKANKGKQSEAPKTLTAQSLDGLGKIGNGDFIVVTNVKDNELAFTKYVSKDTGAVAELLAPQLQGPTMFVDWGGVFGLSKDKKKRLKQTAAKYWLFSFTTPKKIGSELEAMVDLFFAAGGSGLIILTQKKGKQGKAALMNALVPLLNHQSSYYEDSVKDVIDELATGNIKVHWVQPQAPTEEEINEAAANGEVCEDYSQVIPKSKDVEHLTQDEFLQRLFE